MWPPQMRSAAYPYRRAIRQCRSSMASSRIDALHHAQLIAEFFAHSFRLHDRPLTEMLGPARYRNRLKRLDERRARESAARVTQSRSRDHFSRKTAAN